MKFKYSLFVVLAGIFWGSMGVFVHLLTDYFGLSSLQSSALRIISAAIILFLFVLFYDKKLFAIKWRDVPVLVCNGIFSIFLLTVFYFVSINSDTSMSISAVLLYTAPFMVMFMSCIFLSEKITFQKIIALTVAFGGCLLVSVSEPGYSTPKGIIFGVLSGVAYALYSIFGKIALKKYHAYTVTFYSFFFASIGAIVLAFLTDLPSAFCSTGKTSLLVLSVFGTGLITAVLPFLLYTKGLSGTSPSKASIMAYMEPISACVFGYFMGENMTFFMILGIVLTLLSIVLLNVQIPFLSGRSDND